MWTVNTCMLFLLHIHPTVHMSIFNIEWTSCYYNFRPAATNILVSSKLQSYLPTVSVHPPNQKSLQTRICCISERDGKGKPTLSPHPLRWFRRSGEDKIRTLENAKGIFPELGYTKHWGKCKRYHLICENAGKWWIHLWSDILSMHFLSQGILVAL